LFELGPNDAVTYLGAAAILGLIAILAAWVPASRAARLDPTITLRSE
jgi:ABC-type antimicrobial peptide transport system permease subunit